MTLYGIDVSRYQAGISWPAVKQTGVEYSIARASIGLARDSTFETMRDGAQKVGLLAGAYHFLEPGDGKAQADVFLGATNACHGILAALDCEAQGLTIGLIRDFVERFTAKTDRPLFIYTGISFWARLGNPSIKELGPLWLAYYPKGGYPGDHSPIWDKVIGGVKPTIWQYGPRPVKGRKPVDGDAFRGTRLELEAFVGGDQGGPQLPEEPVSTFKPAAGRFAVPVGTPIFDAPNGKAISTVQANSAYVNGMLTVLGGISGWRVCVVNSLTAAWIAADKGQDFPPVVPSVDCDDAVNAALDHVAGPAAAVTAAIAEARPR